MAHIADLKFPPQVLRLALEAAKALSDVEGLAASAAEDRPPAKPVLDSLKAALGIIDGRHDLMALLVLLLAEREAAERLPGMDAAARQQYSRGLLAELVFDGG